MKPPAYKLRVIEFNKNERTRSHFDHHLSDAIILTQDQKILLQHRPAYKHNPPYLSAFGGHVENDETITEGLLRELKEELGAHITEKEVIKLHTLTENFTNHRDAVHVFFWHDRHGKITGCFEHNALRFESLENALKHPDIMDYVSYSLNICKRRRDIP